MSDCNKLCKRAWCNAPGHVVILRGIVEHGYELEEARQLLIDLAAAVREAEKPVDPFEKWWADNQGNHWLTGKNFAKSAFDGGRASSKSHD